MGDIIDFRPKRSFDGISGLADYMHQQVVQLEEGEELAAVIVLVKTLTNGNRTYSVFNTKMPAEHMLWAAREVEKSVEEQVYES